MCKTIDVQNNRCAKNEKKTKTVYWDLINSNVNKRDVQTGCSGYVHKAAIRVVRIYVLQLTIL